MENEEDHDYDPYDLFVCPADSSSAPSALFVKDIPSHFDHCPLKEIDCENKCGESFQRQDKNKHMEECPLVEVPCFYGCGGTHARNADIDHYDRCPSVPLPCPNDPCNSVVQRGKIKQHLKNECEWDKCPECGGFQEKTNMALHLQNYCNEVMVPCPYGCGVQLKRHEVADHEEQ
eukprot:CAMPEP_0174267712 /NCGR_PEP_ID=MMETSP0439-20130205/34644_1 /TAXON_ID=0 /ORGANISM="Stereomyxa ramosa, Strain Chinc5" /LENGTH=174 /DNA_ID=CAMNT_0015355369 /DNA_START=207 /DNA_END=728 /DNA_ORIENTATION=+